MATSGIVRRVGRRLKREVLGATAPGAVDACDGAFISGWASPAHAQVAILHGDRRLLETVASLPRPDVAAAGAGPLESGFRVPLSAVVEALASAEDQGAPAVLRVVGSSGANLPGAPDVAVVADDVISAAALGLARGQGA